MKLVNISSTGIEGTAISGCVPITTKSGTAIKRKILICLHTLQGWSAITTLSLQNAAFNRSCY